VREPIYLIVNPAAGGGRGRKMRRRVEDALGGRGVRFQVRETQARGQASELAQRALDAGAGAIYAVGGDGTAHEVANGILASGSPAEELPALGIVPVGTGNDFARMLGVTRHSPLDALDPAPARVFDVGRLDWDGGSEYFINGSGTGIDVEVVRQIERLPRMPGIASYLIGVLRALAHYRPTPVRIRIDGEEVDRKVMIVAVMNGSRQAGGFHVCPGARPDDGRIDLCVVDELGIVESLRVLPRVLKGTHANEPAITLARASCVEIESLSTTPLFFQVDGELRTPERTRWLRFQVQPQSLRVLPASATAPEDNMSPEASTRTVDRLE